MIPTSWLLCWLQFKFGATNPIKQCRRRAQYSTDAAATSFWREKEKQAAEAHDAVLRSRYIVHPSQGREKKRTRKEKRDKEKKEEAAQEEAEKAAKKERKRQRAEQAAAIARVAKEKAQCLAHQANVKHR